MTIRSEARLQQSLDEVTRLLDKHRVLETLAHRQEGPKRDLLEGLQHRQNLAELGKFVRTMHGADLAFVLESLRPDDRRLVWEQATPEQAGRAFVEVTSVVREWLVEETPQQVGHHMTRKWVMVPETSTVQQAIDELRRLGELPPQTDRVFVVDSRHVFRGSIPLPTLLLKDPTSPVIGAVAPDTVTFEPAGHVHQAVKAFERYDLVSAPVVDDRGKLVGRLTVDTVMDLARDEADLRALAVDQLKPSGAWRVLNKELLVSLLNGSVWGVVVGLVALALYSNVALSVVMTSAVVLNLVVAAFVGVAIPPGLHATGRDPAYGSSVLLTFVTDAMGFFLFLGLASVILF